MDEKGMSRAQLSRVLREVRGFQDVIFYDQLPSIIYQKPQSYVVNSDEVGSEGEHWMVVNFPSNDVAEFFDSLGKGPQFYHPKIVNCLLANSRSYKFNTKRLQDKNSTVCGQYCALYLYTRQKGISMEEFLSQFSLDYKSNDDLVAFTT